VPQAAKIFEGFSPCGAFTRQKVARGTGDNVGRNLFLTVLNGETCAAAFARLNPMKAPNTPPGACDLRNLARDLFAGSNIF
jgi:hypothetical protein